MSSVLDVALDPTTVIVAVDPGKVLNRVWVSNGSGLLAEPASLPVSREGVARLDRLLAEHDAVEPQSFQQRTAQRQHLRRIVAQAARKLDQVPATRPPVGRQRHQQRMLESGGARDVDAAPRIPAGNEQGRRRDGRIGRQLGADRVHRPPVRQWQHRRQRGNAIEQVSLGPEVDDGWIGAPERQQRVLEVGQFVEPRRIDATACTALQERDECSVGGGLRRVPALFAEGPRQLAPCLAAQHRADAREVPGWRAGCRRPCVRRPATGGDRMRAPSPGGRGRRGKGRDLALEFVEAHLGMTRLQAPV